MVLLLTLVLLLTPVPLSNVAPAKVVSLISLAYIEEDGLLLSVAVLSENPIRLRSRIVGWNHRMIADDVRAPAFARNICHGLLQVAAPT